MAEGPVVEQFAQIYEGKVRVVGMGAQDDLDFAERFLERTGVSTPLMTWDASFETWAYYQVRGQPVTILLDPNGNPLGQWFGLSSEIVDLIDA